MISFVECSMAIQNVLMILLEICMILELILLLVRITCFSGKKKIVTAVAVFAVSFMFMGVLMNDHRYCLGESSYQPMLQGYPVSVLMTVKHRKYPVYGVQFHPESIMTPEGKLMLRNFIELAGRKQAEA